MSPSHLLTLSLISEGVFGCPSGDSSISDQLYHLQQWSLPIKEYALRFRTLAAASGWNERSLVTSYRQGLEPRLHLQMSGYDEPVDWKI